MSLQVITANRQVDGAVVYYTADHTWSQWIADAVVSDDAGAADSALALAKASAFAAGIVEPYQVEVLREAQTLKPVRYREAIRARGPSIYTGTQHRMPLATTTAQASTSSAFLNGL